MRPKNPWKQTNLKRLWDERIAPTGMSQEEFGEKYDIGTQGMVSQYLLGTRPLPLDAAVKFARGLGCSIEDICPEMAQTLAEEVFPLLGRRLRRVRRLAMFAVACLIPAIAQPPSSQGAELINRVAGLHIMLNALRRLLIRSALPKFG